jgi:hypothetical protein
LCRGSFLRFSFPATTAIVLFLCVHLTVHHEMHIAFIFAVLGFVVLVFFVHLGV